MLVSILAHQAITLKRGEAEHAPGDRTRARLERGSPQSQTHLSREFIVTRVPSRVEHQGKCC